MRRSRTSKNKSTSTQIWDNVSQVMTNAIADVDEEAAARRVADLRERYPGASIDDLVAMLIKSKCMRAGTVGAVTSGTALIPGIGTVAALTFGVAADIGITFMMQAELVLEIAAAHQYQLDGDEKRRVILLVTGISAGANQVLQAAGTRIAQRTSQRLAEKSILKAIPVVGVGASAGTNFLTTYIIGQRAHAYFSQSPEAMGDWAESVRAISGVDERKLIGWLSETTENSWTLVKDRAHSAADSVIVVATSTGELAVVSAGKARRAMTAAGRSVAEGTAAAAGATAHLGKRAGTGIASGARKARDTMKEAVSSVADRADADAEPVAGKGKPARAGISNWAEKAGDAIQDALQSAAEAAAGAKQRFSKVFRGIRRGKRGADPEDQAEAAQGPRGSI